MVWAQSSTYVSSIDSELTIQRWTTYPAVDNLDGIYAKPLQTHLQSLMENDFAFRWTEPAATAPTAPEDFEEKPQLGVEFMKKSKVDAFITTRIAKGPKGLSIRMVLFSGNKTLPLAVEVKSEIHDFEIEHLKKDLTQIYRQMKNKLPYRGTLLSRRGTTVTLNLGKESGLQLDQEIYAIQIVKANRHPKFGFLISVEKEIMGKIKITKVEENLSFGSIISERSEGILKAGFKVTYEDFVQYPGTARAKDGTLLTDLSQRTDADVAFGQNPKEWTPITSPNFGKIALMLGFGSYTAGNNFLSGTSMTGQNYFVPSVHIEGEMWLSSEWFFNVELHQYVTKISNSLGSPSDLELQTQEAELVGGYNFLASEEFWGPKLQLMFGLSQMDSKIASDPSALSSVKYDGMAFGLAGIIPLGQEKGSPFSLGGKFMYHLNTNLTETPATSGTSSSNRVSTFSVFGEYQLQPRLALKSELSFHQYSSTFSGTGTRGIYSATSGTHSITTLAGGVVFLF